MREEEGGAAGPDWRGAWGEGEQRIGGGSEGDVVVVSRAPPVTDWRGAGGEWGDGEDGRGNNELGD